MRKNLEEAYEEKRMRIIVCIKQVPDTREVRIDPVTNNLVRQGVPGMINPSDLTAFSAALKLREMYGGSITLLSMGPAQAAEELERGLSMGADRAVLLCDRRFGGADTLATSYTLSEAVRKIGYDLVLCGNEAIDGCTGQVGPMIGEWLGIPAFTYVEKVEKRGEKLLVTRAGGRFRRVYSAEMPAVVCMLNNEEMSEMPDNTPPDVPKTELWDADGFDQEKIGLDGSRTRVSSISVSGRKENYLQVEPFWDLETRMDYIFRGGLTSKQTELTRGESAYLAETIVLDLKQMA